MLCLQCYKIQNIKKKQQGCREKSNELKYTLWQMCFFTDDRSCVQIQLWRAGE